MSAPVRDDRDVTLLELLDRALNKGVILWGDITLSVADVDLIFVGLKVLLCSVETADRMRSTAASRLLTSGRNDTLVEKPTVS